MGVEEGGRGRKRSKRRRRERRRVAPGPRLHRYAINFSSMAEVEQGSLLPGPIPSR